VYDAKRQWGAHLHIPLSYRTIEEMVPAAVAHRPRMLYLPRHEQWEHNVQNVRLLIDAQQENIDIDLPFQAVMRSGRIYGLGVGKTFWRKDYEPAREVRQRMFRPGKFYLGKRKFKCSFDDPDFEAVDIFDFMWDPMGGGLLGSNRCRWVVHRLWMGPEQVLDRVQSGLWNTQSAQGLTVEKLQAMGNGQKYDEIWQERLSASGFGSMNMSVRGDQVHEVWEWHDGDRVLTALDRQVLVQEAENGCRGFPFSAYRPTPLQGQMVGIGDLEPLEHLQSELDTLRSQRRDGATLALAAPVVYDSGAIDEEQLVWGPGSAMGLDNVGDVRAAIMRLQVGDVPGSGYEEERVIRSDFDAVSGISAALDPNSGGQISTATEAQLVQAALGRRISLSSRRFEIEVVRQAARQFLALNQRMILEPRPPIRQPGEGLDEYQAAEEGRWKWFPIGPGELRGEFTIIPEGGSMAARNIPQDRQDAQIFFTMAQNNEHVDPRWALLKGLDLMGVRDPEAALEAAGSAGAAERAGHAGADGLRQAADRVRGADGAAAGPAASAGPVARSGVADDGRPVEPGSAAAGSAAAGAGGMKHGTTYAYRTRRCRCELCREAHSARSVRKARKRGGPVRAPTVRQGPIEEFLSDLLHELFPDGLTDDCPARRAAA
jgi:hypothetical protein